MATNPRKIYPLTQTGRPKCSLPLTDADLSLGNANWSKGFQAMSDWIWSGNLNPAPFPNNLGRYFLQIPGIFEQQLNFSTTLIFDEPSFKNGVQISGFVNRVSRELAISLIAQRRRCWYSMTHHAILGRLTAIKHGLTEQQYVNKWRNLTEHRRHPEFYSRVEQAVLEFTDAFATDPKTYSDMQYKELREALFKENEERYSQEGLWLVRMNAAREARALALLRNTSAIEVDKAAAMNVSNKISSDLNERIINAQVVELAFLCLQFVALTCVLTGLNIPDEDFLPGVMMEVVPAAVLERINELNELGLRDDVPELLPGPASENPGDLAVKGELFNSLLEGQVIVEPAPLKGARIPLTPYEGKDDGGNFRPAFACIPDRDNGLTIGGIQVGVYGWSFGGHFPGSLPYALMHHPELARYEAPYSLPLLFNEDEWRNGTQTAGFVTRRLKELVIQKIYRLNRSRYGLEHHTMFFYNTYYDEHGVGRTPRPDLTDTEKKKALNAAKERAYMAIMYINDHSNAPKGIYTSLEKEIMSWTECLLRKPHKAYEIEEKVRSELEKGNRREVEAGLRHLDTSPGIGVEAALKRLVDHQVSELAMMIGHMDGLGRALTILRLEAEDAVQMVEGRTHKGGIIPNCDKEGRVKFTGYFNNRPSIHQILRFIGVSDAVLTLNELTVNPGLCKKVKSRLRKGEKEIHISAEEAVKSGEF